MDGDGLWSIGELSRRTGVSVKTIRYYSERGIVVPAGRTPGGYRRYGAEAAERVALVRTLRELGVGLDVVRRVVEREASLADVAARHAAALEARIGVLRMRRAVLAVVARGGADVADAERLHGLVRLSEEERLRLVEEFLDGVFGGQGGDRGPLGAARRSLAPELPADATEEQLEAWVELLELAADEGFREAMRRSAEEYAGDGGGVPRPDAVAVVRERAGAALAAGIAPGAPEAGPVVAACLEAGGPEGGAALLRRLVTANVPSRDRYGLLLARVNGWPAPEPLAPALDWAVEALRLRTVPE
ncbi:MerR family transcriptional regulator [Streptomyces sp. NPDC058052]|uniref:MerR family transcriptional regulator n=1 Tax=Streptomyces sp. NPDC058052 TaxID=3346316 RepID=UPI0036EBAC86